MTNDTRTIVGTFTVRAPHKTTESFECAAWYRNLLIEPGTYTVVAYIGWRSRAEGTLGGSLVVEIPQEKATITAASFIALFGGTAIRGSDGKTIDPGPEEVGTHKATSIHLPTYDLDTHVHSGALVLDTTIIVESPYTNEEGTRRMFYRLRRTSDGMPASEGASQAV